ncbi:MAG: dienelactone hydrolase family protein [Lysobacteraceae bacterium]|nr:MAG: dienelactone hydrolase family protein [Xanthomonadaceae bacterium]
MCAFTPKISCSRITPPRGAVILLQEIFGVNAHIRAVADGYARDGLVVIAPSLFDPVQPQVELGYGEEDFARGRELVASLGMERALQVVDAAARRLRESGHRPGVVGYCWGGSVAFLANARLGLPAVSYYGARTVPFLAEPARAPMLFHFGGKDSSTPAEDIQRHRDAQPDATVFVYPEAGHAFNRDVDPHHFHAGSAVLARRRTLDFLLEHTS